jgi:hypothetical protein
MKSLAPMLVAGGTSAGAIALGLIGGILVSNRTHQPAWVLAGLGLGVGLSGFVLVRALMRSA